MDILSQCRYIQCWTGPEQHPKALGSTRSLRFLPRFLVAVFQQEALVMLADRCLFLVIRWLQLTTVTVKATIHLTLIQRDFSDSSRECGARGQPPRSAQVSGCAGGSGVSEALALPQSPPCNPDPPERARRGGGASRRHAPSRHRLTPRRPRPLQPGSCTRRNFQRP